MDNKARRNYTISIETDIGETLSINPPFTVEFDVVRNLLSSVNTMTLKIYNLAEKTRGLIYKDIYDYLKIRSVEFQAGYGLPTATQQNILNSSGISIDAAYAGQGVSTLQLPTAFKGNIGQAWSVRHGVDFVTTIEGYDGGYAFANGEINTTFASGKSNADVLKEVCDSLPNVSPGVIGNYPGSLSRGSAISGSPAEIAQSLTNGGFFVDNEKYYCLGDDECISGNLAVITSESGLLGTPIREKTLLKFDILFEPRLLIGQIVELKSITEKNFNGLYKVVSLNHHGIISESVCGEAITSVGLWKGPSILKVVG